MRPFRILFWSTPALSLLYLSLRSILPEAEILTEVALYNSIPLAAVLAILASPVRNHPITIISMVLAITTWWFASAISSYSEFISPSEFSFLYSNSAYLLFYPLLFISLSRASEERIRVGVEQSLDLLIFSILLLSLLIMIFLDKIGKPVENFTAADYQLALYLLAGGLLSIWVAKTLIFNRLSKRNLLLISGVTLFAISDFFFIWSELGDSYNIGSLSDIGWVLSISLISIALWQVDLGDERESGAPTFFLTSALLLTPALLIYLALNSASASPLLLAPALIALALLIFRMALLVQVGQKLSNESHLANTDELTGLANRRRLVAELSALESNEGAFLLLDLNGFKPINDQYGHGVGDQLLQEVAERFKRALPADAIIGRLGGDEFGIIIRGSYEDTLEGAYALRASLSYPFTLSGEKITVGVSIGHVQNDGAGELLKRADLAMYQAKRLELGVVQS